MCVRACPVSRQLAWDGGLALALELSVTRGQWNSARYFGSLYRVKRTCLYMWRTQRSAKTNTRSHRIGSMAYTHTHSGRFRGHKLLKEMEGEKRWEGKWKGDWFRRWGWVCVALTDAELASSDKNLCGLSFWLGNPVIIGANHTILYRVLSSTLSLFFLLSERAGTSQQLIWKDKT